MSRPVTALNISPKRHTYHILLCSLLLLLLHKGDILFRYALQHAYAILQHLLYLIRHVSLYHDLVEALCVLGDGGSGGELLSKLFGGFLQVNVCVGTGLVIRG